MSRGPPSRSEELSESSRHSQSHNPLDDDAALQTEEVQNFVYSPANKGAGAAAAAAGGGASTASTPASSVKELQSQLQSASLSPRSSPSASPANASGPPDRPPPLVSQHSVTFHKAGTAAGAAGGATVAASNGSSSASASPSLPPASPSAAAAAAAPIVRTNEMARLELTRTVKEGTLTKLGAKVKNWKSRYFRLVGYVLTYHESKEQLFPVLGEIHLTATLCKAEPESLFNMPYCFSITQTQAGQRTYYCVAANKEEMEEWLHVLKQRHSFAPQGLPLKLNPRVHINMNLNPDEQALRAIAVNSQPINSSYISTDANRKENSKSTLKGAVSKKKRRFVMDGFDLDLTYITNRIIAMGFPADGSEAIYRNDMKDVQLFLNTRHKDHYKVYNLCSERKYDHAKFAGRVLEFPFDDHNCPSFEDLPFFCKDVADFLSEDEKNVVVIHCKAGKGRTGLLITQFLLYCGEWQTASEALRYYAFARTQNQKGVTIASQIRWVHYWEKYLSLSRDGVGLPPLEALSLRKMVFSKKAPSFDYFVAGCHGEFISSKDKDVKLRETKLKDGGYEIEFLPGGVQWVFLKDFQFEFYKGKMFGGKARVMSFWLHTQFLALEPNYYLKMEKMDIDKVSKDKSCSDFSLELFFEPVVSGPKAVEAKKQPELEASPLLSPQLTSALSSIPPDVSEMMLASLTMMLEGRKMSRYYLGDRSLREKEVEKRDVFLVLKDETPIDADANAPRTYALWWCPDAQSLAGASPAAMVFETIRIGAIGSLLIGKQADIWSRTLATKSAVEDRCFSLYSRDGAVPKVELHLEAYSERQLSLWIEGIKFLLERVGGGQIHETEGDLFPVTAAASNSTSNTPSIAVPAAYANAPAAAPAATAASSGPAPSPSNAASAGAAFADPAADEIAAFFSSRGRAESFARPPPLRVPQNRHRRVISVQQHK